MDRDRLRSLFNMTGRVVVVTGGTRGIGRALAEGYVAAGAKMVVASRKPEAWSKWLDANLRDPVFLVQEALPHLKRSRRVAVLDVLSGSAFLFSATVSLYANGKAGLMTATRAMAAEFEPHGIRVNALSPDTVDTDMVRKNTPEARAVMTEIGSRLRGIPCDWRRGGS